MSETTTGPSRSRVVWIVAGTLLWVGVFARLWWVWDQGRKEAQPQSRRLYPEVPVEFQPWELPDFELTDQNGKTVRKQNLLGRQWVASFLFTRCTAECPMIAGRMRDLRDSVPAGKARIVTITVDPGHDTPAVLKRYAKTYGSNGDRWLFLTGREDVVYPLIKDGFKGNAVKIKPEDREPGREVSHDQRVLHIDETGRVIGKYDGTSQVEMERLRRAISARAKKKHPGD